MRKLLLYFSFLTLFLMLSVIANSQSVVTDSLNTTIYNSDFNKYPVNSLQNMLLLYPGNYYLGRNLICNSGIFTDNYSTYLDGMQLENASGFSFHSIGSFSYINKNMPLSLGYSPAGIIQLTTPESDKVVFNGFLDTNIPFVAGREGNPVLENSAFNYQTVELNMSTPIPLKNKAKKLWPHFFLAANFYLGKDSGPSFAKKQKVKGSVYDELVANPYSNNGFYPILNSEVIDKNDVEEVSFTPGTSQKNGSFYGKFSIPLSNAMKVESGLYYYFENNNVDILQNRMFNYCMNPEEKVHQYNGFLRFNHILAEKKDFKLEYKLQAEYYTYNYILQDKNHKGNLFDYGYIGKFSTERVPVFSSQANYDPVLGKDVYQMVGMYSTGLTFAPGEANPILANYTSTILNMFPNEINNIDELLSNRGLANGYMPEDVYDLYNSQGTVYDQYVKSNRNRLDFSGVINMSYGKNNMELGFSYEKSTRRYYSISPVSLYQCMVPLTNNQLSSLDMSDPTLLVINGRVTDSAIYHFAYNAEGQTEFDKKLRNKLGLQVNGTEWIDINSYDAKNHTIDYYDENYEKHTINVGKDLFSLDLFNESEMSRLISGYGYDYKGNKVKAGSNDLSYFDTYMKPAFAPVDYAAWISYKRNILPGLKVEAGLRAEVYDAGLNVLKDPYTLSPIKTVAEVTEFTHPDNIGKNYVVYIDSYENPTAVTGYRNENTWYDHNGLVINDPSNALDYGNGVIPYLKNHTISKNAYRKDKNTFYLLPKLMISYNITPNFLLYADYSSATKHPYYELLENRILNPSYYYQNCYINELKPMFFNKSTLGFNTKPAKNWKLGLSFMEQQIKNLITPYYYSPAWPTSYIGYKNRNKTVNNVFLEFNTSYTTPDRFLTAGANYTHGWYDKDIKKNGLQQYYLTTSENIANLFAMINFDKWSKGLSIAFTEHYRSGIPYMETIANVLLVGYAKMDDFYSTNIKIQKTMVLYKKSPLYLTIYLQVNNVFNRENTFNVYSSTGKVDDDGYLAAPENQYKISQKLSPDTYRLLYANALDNPTYYDSPRTLHLGIKINF
ncbi:MAG: hypothetical protein M0R21_07610 [Lentimicrobiaceae bacterium]|nr:hypothetical protein [Lentimicrobiaceae bacterium]